MDKTHLLDCTFRDGGYYTNWFFESSIVEQYFDLVKKLPIDIVEAGYLTKTSNNFGPFYNLDSCLLKEFKQKLRVNQKLFAMINMKDINNSNDLDQIIRDKKKYLDGIRFAINPQNIQNNLKKIRIFKNKNKKLHICLNIMYLSKWFEDRKIINQIKSFENENFFSVSFVDSYGFLKPDEVENFAKKIKHIKITKGAHFHNNSDLALANSIIAKNNGFHLIDTTFTGMGRGAGNASTEFYLSIFFGDKIKVNGYAMNNLLTEFKKLKSLYKWGASYEYSVSAQKNIPQSFIMDLIFKKRIEPETAIKLIDSQKKKLKFKSLNFLKTKKKRGFVLLGGSNTLEKYGKFLIDKINQKKILVLCSANALINFYKIKKKHKIKNDIILLISGSEMNKIIRNFDYLEIKKLKFSSVICEELFSQKINLLNTKEIIYSSTEAENPLMLWALICKKIGIKIIEVAFFDGDYKDFKEKLVFEETNECIKKINNLGLKILSFTPSYFDLFKNKNIYLND